VIDCVDYRLEFARTYAPCEAHDFRSLEEPVVFIKRTTESLGADVCIDAVGAEAAGSTLQTILGRKLLMQGVAATALRWATNSVKKGGIVSIVGVYGPIDTLVPVGSVVNKGIIIFLLIEGIQCSADLHTGTDSAADRAASGGNRQSVHPAGASMVSRCQGTYESTELGSIPQRF
jgi:threonine dehydrogenase-like Zn-dependent dehydrogenase